MYAYKAVSAALFPDIMDHLCNQRYIPAQGAIQAQRLVWKIRLW